MNILEIKKLKTPSDYETDVFVIDGRPLYEYLNEWVNGNEQLLYKPDVLAICWTNNYDFEGDARFMRFVLAQDTAITPILSCPEDFDFSCTVVVADVEKHDDVVIWKRIGTVNHSKEIFEEEKRHGILYLNSYTDEDWYKYGDNIALEEVDSNAWCDWIGKNWTEELYRRRINYTYPKYQDEENIDWIAECNFAFNRSDYDRLVESRYYTNLNLAEKLILFDKMGDAGIFKTSKRYSFQEYRVICLELLEWLKLEHKRFLWKNEGRPTWSKPHILSPETDFTRLIPDFIYSDETFKHSLKITGDKLYFSDEITEEEIRIITKAAFDYYKTEIAYF